MTLTQFAEKYGLKQSTLRMRITRGETGLDLLRPVKKGCD